MIRFLVRVVGFFALAGAFVAAVIDGARSLANQDIRIAKLGETLYWLAPAKFSQIVTPWAAPTGAPFWGRAAILALTTPTALALLIAGFVLAAVGRPARR